MEQTVPWCARFVSAQHEKRTAVSYGGICVQRERHVRLKVADRGSGQRCRRKREWSPHTVASVGRDRKAASKLMNKLSKQTGERAALSTALEGA